MSAQYPQHKILRDIGSGINWKRPGLRSLVQACLRGTLQEVVVAHRDRLSRLGFELLEFLIEQSGARIVVMGGGEKSTTEQELGEDLLSIIHVFSSRHYGMRKYSTSNPKRRKRDRATASGETSEGGQDETAERPESADAMQEDQSDPDQGTSASAAEDLRHSPSHL
jgi:predicted site-specific integrase-resolvase